MTAATPAFTAVALIAISATAAKAEKTTTRHSSNGNTVIITQQTTPGEKPEVKVETRDGYLSVEQKAGRNRAVVIQRRGSW